MEMSVWSEALRQCFAMARTSYIFFKICENLIVVVMNQPVLREKYNIK